jgi:hypothetical protein
MPSSRENQKYRFAWSLSRKLAAGAQKRGSQGGRSRAGSAKTADQTA